MAIVRDATSGFGSSAGSSVTLAHTCTGSNLILFAMVYSGINSGDSVTGVTYNGVAMTQAVKVARSDNTYLYIYYLINPATGANNIVASRSNTTGNINVGGASYTGVKQSAQPDATGSNNSAGAASLTTTLTTIADKCWSVLFCAAVSGGETASTNSTDLIAGNGIHAFDNQTFGDITPAGSFSMTFTCTNSAVAAVMASFAPVVPAVAAKKGYTFII